jgi:hypothetical protein
LHKCELVIWRAKTRLEKYASVAVKLCNKTSLSGSIHSHTHHEVEKLMENVSENKMMTLRSDAAFCEKELKDRITPQVNFFQ